MNRIYLFHFREQTIKSTYIQHFFHLEYNLLVHPVQKKYHLSNWN